MADFSFNVKEVRNQRAFQAVRYCVDNVLVPHLKITTKPSLNRAQNIQDELRRQWRARLGVLQVDGWCAGKSFSWYRNCPPTGCITDTKANVCNLFFCPFCYSRKLVGVYIRLLDALTVPKLPLDPSVNVRWRDYKLVVLRSRNTLNANRPFSDVRDKMEEYRSGRFDKIPYLGFYQHFTVQPVVQQFAYGVSRSSLIILDRNADFVAPEADKRTDYDKLSHKVLLAAVKQVCRYPLGWMREPTTEMIPLIEAFHGYRWSSMRGILRKSHNRKCKDKYE